MRTSFKLTSNFCPGGNYVEKVCYNTNCLRPVNICFSNQCIQCKNHTHSQKYKIKLLKDILNKKQTVLKKYQNDLNQKLKQIKIKMKHIEAVIEATLNHNLNAISQRIKILSQSEIKLQKMMNDIESSQEITKLQIRQILQKNNEFVGEQQEFFRDLKKVKVFEKDLYNLQRALKKELGINDRFFSSQIIQNQQQQRFLRNSLDSVKIYSLLFRASDYDYSAAQFHKICDGLSNTLLVFENDKGIKMGVFSPKVFNSYDDEIDYDDISRDGLIFNLTNEDIFYPIQSKLISNNQQNNSLSFRAGDFTIVDRCDIYQSFCHVNRSYYNDKYKSSDQWSNERMTGSTDGRFLIKKLEIWKVEFWKDLQILDT